MFVVAKKKSRALGKKTIGLSESILYKLGFYFFVTSTFKE
jgi:hypothetical protein